jgi:CheY-like chemotaxis protein
MPKMVGFELIEAVRHSDNADRPAIVVLTPGALGGDVERCRELGVSAYLLNPIREAELRSAITRAIEN